MADKEEKKLAGLENSDNELLELMRARELREARAAARDAAIEERQLAQIAEKRARARASFLQAQDTKFKKWQLCDHTRGKTGRGFKSLPKAIRGLMINLHEFPNGDRRLKCERCGAKWWKYVRGFKIEGQVYNEDSQEFLVRDGELIPNPTGLSYRDVLKMFMEDDSDQTHFSRAMRFVTTVEPSPFDRA